MRSALLVPLALTACLADTDTSSSSQDLRSRCPPSNPDCEAPDDPPDDPPPGHPHDPPPPSDPACNALVTGSLSTSATAPVWMGTPIVLTWQVQLPTTCTATGGFIIASLAAGISADGTGATTVKPLASQTYRLLYEGRQLAAVTVTTLLPSQIKITANTDEQRALFMQGIATDNQTVLLQHDLELDLSQYATTGVNVNAGVTIAGAAPDSTTTTAGIIVPGGGIPGPYSIARDSRHLGPKLFTNVRPVDHFIQLTGDNATLRGFRVFGPDIAMTDGFGRGIVINSAKHVELDRLEVAGFSEAGIYVMDSYNQIDQFTDVSIHDCFIHHNQRAPGGDGYGIETLEGAKALIRHNVFDFNRHSISSGWQPGTGYWADENLVLRGGGYHEGFGGYSWHTHSFDVHGRDDDGVLVDLGLAEDQFNSGPAGDEFFITKNAFQYTAGVDFKLRGTPAGGAYLTDNVFPLGDSDKTYVQYETGLHLLNNTFNKDTFGKYGVCDFDADGIDDLFLATGRTWWFSSGGKFHWTFLNSATEELAQLGLGDFNHDGRCDVMRERNNTWEISSGGTGPFVALPAGFSGPMSQLRFVQLDVDGYTDVFQRVPGGQWYGYTRFDVATPILLQSSGSPIEDLRFGDFDNDRITDVLAIAGGVWSWSKNARDIWHPWNSRYSSLGDVVAIANVDGQPGDDVIRLTNVSLGGGRLEISSAGSGAWTTLTDMSWYHDVDVSGQPRVYGPVLFAGRFNSPLVGTASLLKLDSYQRFTTQLSAGTPFLPHSLYAH
ncbi:MAG: right-handed parallel beta-helix repeat-containing protein [Kofleriaceae bacterium]